MDDYSSVGWQKGHWIRDLKTRRIRDLKGLEQVI